MFYVFHHFSLNKHNAACLEYLIQPVLYDAWGLDFIVMHNPFIVLDSILIEDITALDGFDVRDNYLDKKEQENDCGDEQIDNCMRPSAQEAVLDEQEKIHFDGDKEDET